MFDKMTLKTKINFSEEAGMLAERNHLQLCTESGEIYYQSSAYGNFEGIFIKIRGDTCTIKCSLHKLFEHEQGNTFDNSTLFTVSQARRMIDVLFDNIGIKTEQVKVTYYEIGVNLIMPEEAIRYIEKVKSVNSEKEMFIDANYEKNRQKTTDKSKFVRKVLKMYDKSFEYMEKRKPIPLNILRCETIYRRQSILILELFNPKYISKILGRFKQDWMNIEFPVHLEYDKGIRLSEVEKAREIMQKGRETYYNESRERYIEKDISKEQWRGIRNFIDNFDNISHKFRYKPISDAYVYQDILKKTLQKALM